MFRGKVENQTFWLTFSTPFIDAVFSSNLNVSETGSPSLIIVKTSQLLHLTELISNHAFLSHNEKNGNNFQNIVV